MCGTRPSERKPIIGLAGGIGAGKSTVARTLAELGAGIVASDEISRSLICRAEVVGVLRQWWGDSILDAEGRVDRQRIGDRVFGDAAQRARLEQLLHPLVAQERGALIKQFQGDAAVRAIVLDSPLLYEAGLDRECDVVWFVEAERGVRARRLEQVRHWSLEELDRREKLQKPLDFKRAKADYRIVNNSSIEDLRLQVARLFSLVVRRTEQSNRLES